LEATGLFEIKRPELEVKSLTLATKPAKKESPAEISQEFKQTDTVCLTVEVNYMLKAHHFTTRWFDEKNKLIKEITFDIQNDDFKKKHIYFALQSDSGIFRQGNYEVEIFQDEKLIRTLQFKIIKTELELSVFSKETKYENKEKGFSFLIPDNWKTLEFENKGQFQAQIIPPLSNMEIGFLFLTATEIKDFSEESFTKIADNILKPFILEKELKVVEIKKENKITENQIEYYEIKNTYIDKNSNKWLMPFCFIVQNNNVYILYGIVNETMFSASAADEIFYGIINSLNFEQ
jgi:hypothetical protein